MEKISVKIGHKQLSVNFWESTNGEQKGIFYIHHGMAEHIDRYKFFAEHFTSEGYHVVGHNHLGHGDNKENGEGIFARSQGWERVCSEASSVTEYFHSIYPDLPSYVFGHSMGAFISISTLKDIKNLNGVILTGTFLPSKTQLYLLKLLLLIERKIFMINENSKIHKINFQRLNAFFKNSRTNFDWLAKDYNVVDKYIDDPDCGFNCSNSLWLDFMNGSEKVLEDHTYLNIDKNIKILLAGGADDPCIVNGKGIDGLKSYLSKKFNSVGIKIFKDMRHEIHNEQSKNELLALIGAFINNE